jgi:hypothetical protein
MTGQPAGTWWRFRFATVPRWAYWFFLLLCTGVGLLPIFIIFAVVSRRASGHLPLTFSSRGRLRLVNWIVISTLPLMVLLFIAAAIVGSNTNDQTGSTITFSLVMLAALSFVGFVVGYLVVRPLVGPRATVMEQQPGYYDKLVELRNVHPAFVTAVNQVHQQRAANLPQMPGST